MNEAHLGIALMWAVGLGVYGYYVSRVGVDEGIFFDGAFGLYTIFGWFLGILSAVIAMSVFTYITGVNPLLG